MRNRIEVNRTDEKGYDIVIEGSTLTVNDTYQRDFGDERTAELARQDIQRAKAFDCVGWITRTTSIDPPTLDEVAGTEKGVATDQRPKKRR